MRDYSIELKLDAAGKYRCVGDKGNNGAVEFGGTDFFNIAFFLAYRIFLHVRGAVAVHLYHAVGGERVHDRGADAVETAGDFVSLAAEFAARVERGHDSVQRGDFCLLVDVDRDAPAVVGDTHETAGQKHYLDIVGKAAHRLVARVVKNLPHQVVQAVGARGADIHARPAAHRLEAFQYRNIGSAVTAFFSLFRGHIYLFILPN